MKPPIATLIRAGIIIPAKADIKPGSRIRPGVTNCIRLMSACIITFLIAGIFSGPVDAAMEITVQKTLEIKTPPLDVAMSPSRRWIYILTQKGNLLVYSTAGRIRDRISVDPSVDSIKASPQEDVLFLISRSQGTVQIVTLDFIRNIPVEGSPFKGKESAPVTVVVFSEFQ